MFIYTHNRADLKTGSGDLLNEVMPSSIVEEDDEEIGEKRGIYMYVYDIHT
jgi:hypothetical protein